MGDKPFETSPYWCPDPACFMEPMVFPVELKEIDGSKYYEADRLSCGHCGFWIGVETLRDLHGNLYYKQEGIRKLWVKSKLETKRARNVAQTLKEDK